MEVVNGQGAEQLIGELEVLEALDGVERVVRVSLEVGQCDFDIECRLVEAAAVQESVGAIFLRLVE